MTQAQKDRVGAAALPLVGQKVSGVAVMDDGTLQVQFEGGYSADVMCDPEGNGPGSLHVYGPTGKCLGPAGGR